MNKVIKRITIDNEEYDLLHLPEDGEEGSVLTKGSSEGEYNWKYYTPKIWKGTLTEYASITNKEDNCLYFIIEDTVNTEDDSD